MSKKKLFLNLIIINLLIILFVLPIFVLNSFLKYQNVTFFDIYRGDTSNLINSEILIITFCLAILTYFFFSYIFSLKKKSPNFFLYPLVLVSVWILLSSFFFPLSSSQTGIIDPASAGVNKTNLLAVIFFSLILSTFIILKKKINIFIYFSYLFIILNLSFLVFEITKSKSKNVYKLQLNENEKYYKENKKKFIQSTSLSAKKNIIVISIDGITSSVLEDIFNKKPEFKVIFKDFTFYKNIFSQAPATTLSIAGELYGNLDFEEISQYDDELILKLNKLPNIYDKVEDVYTYGDYNTFNKNYDKVVENYLNYKTPSKKFNNISKFEKSIEIYRYSVSRFGTRILVNYFDSVKFYLYEKFFNISIKDLKLSEKTFFHRGATFEKKKITDMTIIQNYIKSINVNNSKNSDFALRMFHFNYSHFPIDFDENCKYFSFNKKNFKSSQNYKGLKKETICSIIILEKFINKLKKLNLYDQTLLIFKSDHGAPSGYFNDSNYASINYKINDHKQFGYFRYKPFLMIKNYKETYNDMRIITEFKSLNYLNFFYCNLIEKNKQNCKEPNKFQIFIPKNKKSTFVLRHLKKINVESENDFINMIVN